MFGEVHSAFVICQPQTNKSRRFGYVEFVEPSIADQVIATEGLYIDGYKIGCRRFGNNRLPNERLDAKDELFKTNKVKALKTAHNQSTKVLRNKEFSHDSFNSGTEISNSFRELLVSLELKKLREQQKRLVNSRLADKAPEPSTLGMVIIETSSGLGGATRSRDKDSIKNTGFAEEISIDFSSTNYRFNLLSKRQESH